MIEFMSGNVRKEFEAIEDRIRENRLSDEELDIQNKRKKKVLIAKICKKFEYVLNVCK